jgi:IS5 family transposase
MQPKDTTKQGKQGHLFQSRLDQILNPDHPLFKLAKQIVWEVFAEEFGALYVENAGRPGKPIRLLVGLHYLKYTYGESDESVVERFVENPYWQYFCGYEYFQHEIPLEASLLTKWRKRVGAGGMEKLLQETVATAKRGKLLSKRDVERVTIDTTVQEKAIAFPTDARLYYKMLRSLVRAARKRRIGLRQSYERVGKKALIRQGRYSHAQQMKRARRETKRLKVYLGRVVRDLERRVVAADETLAGQLALAHRLLQQQRTDTGKLYSIHAPEVECIAKGKAHKRYEFGCKVALVSTAKKNWVVGIDAIHENPYDGHTVEGSLQQTKRITGWQPGHAYCDKGYRGGPRSIEGTMIHITGRRKSSISRSAWGWFKRRAAIEPMFSHLKEDHRMDRNHLKGREGDRINALLSGCGYNMRKLLRAFFWLIFQWLRSERNNLEYELVTTQNLLYAA